MAKHTNLLSVDGNNKPIPCAGTFSDTDGLNQSPVSVGASEVVVTAPANTIGVIIRPTEEILISNRTGVGVSQGYLLDAGIPFPLDIAAGKKIYMIRNSADAVVYLLWQLLD